MGYINSDKVFYLTAPDHKTKKMRTYVFKAPNTQVFTYILGV